MSGYGQSPIFHCFPRLNHGKSSSTNGPWFPELPRPASLGLLEPPHWSPWVFVGWVWVEYNILNWGTPYFGLWQSGLSNCTEATTFGPVFFRIFTDLLESHPAFTLTLLPCLQCPNSTTTGLIIQTTYRNSGRRKVSLVTIQWISFQARMLHHMRIQVPPYLLLRCWACPCSITHRYIDT